MSTEKKKRGPGRPPIDNKGVREERLGLCPSPKYPDSSMELYYASPEIFKKLYTLYKSTNAHNIFITFDIEHVTFMARNFTKKCTIRTTLDCHRAHRYFNKQPITIRISRKHSESVINCIDPKYYSAIQFRINNYHNEPDNIIIDLFNSRLNCCSTNSITVQTINEHEIVELWDQALYRLSFTLDKRDFKKIISDIENITPKFIIEKVEGASPLKLKYNKDVIINTTKTFNDPKKIALQSTMYSNEIIAATIAVDNIKPISNSQVAEFFQLYVDCQHKLMIYFRIDEMMDCKILLEIENYHQ